jgi:hypothetical protein
MHGPGGFPRAVHRVEDALMERALNAELSAQKGEEMPADQLNHRNGSNCKSPAARLVVGEDMTGRDALKGAKEVLSDMNLVDVVLNVPPTSTKAPTTRTRRT